MNPNIIPSVSVYDVFETAPIFTIHSCIFAWTSDPITVDNDSVQFFKHT